MKTRGLIALSLTMILSLFVVPHAMAQEPDVFGTVTDEATGEPVAGASVTLFIAPPPQPVDTTTTDEDGFYAFFDVEQASFVGAEADGYEAGSTEFTYDGSEPVEANIELLSTAGDPAVAGTITDAATGAPLGTTSDEETSGVFLVYDDIGWFGGFDTFFWADESGAFEGYAVDANRAFWLVPDVGGYVPTPAGPYVWDGEATVVANLALDRWFPDVPEGHTHYMNVWHVAAAGVTTGFVDRTFRPADPVIRGQMASFLTRALSLPAGQATFSDVPAGHTHAAGIGAVAAAEITLGYPDGTFRPGLPVTRGQMASFLARALDLPAGQATFSDVPAGHTHAAGIGAVAAAEITFGFPDGTFRPEDPVARGQMASFLVRALSESAPADAEPALYGVVTDAETGEPIAGAEVYYLDYAADGVSLVVTDDAGHYAVEELAEGSMFVSAVTAGYQGGVRHTIHDGETPVEMNLALYTFDGAVQVTGTVTTDAGDPVEGAQVAVAWDGGDPRTWPVAQTAADGTFSIRGVDEGDTFRLAVLAPWEMDPATGMWSNPELFFTDDYAYVGEPLVIDIEREAP